MGAHRSGIRLGRLSCISQALALAELSQPGQYQLVEVATIRPPESRGELADPRERTQIG